jgi:small subunit ribosomal protein S11
MSDELTIQPATVPSEEPSKEVVADGDATKSAAKPKKLKKGKRHVPLGRAYITATYNNTIVSFTDAQGNCLSQSSAGRCGFKGSKKATPYAAGIIVKQAAEKAIANHGLKDVHVYVRGIGSGRDGAIRALNGQGFSILSIHDLTPTPHNGCRPKKARRV